MLTTRAIARGTAAAAPHRGAAGAPQDHNAASFAAVLGAASDASGMPPPQGIARREGEDGPGSRPPSQDDPALGQTPPDAATGDADITPRPAGVDGRPAVSRREAVAGEHHVAAKRSGAEPPAGPARHRAAPSPPSHDDKVRPAPATRQPPPAGAAVPLLGMPPPQMALAGDPAHLSDDGAGAATGDPAGSIAPAGSRDGRRETPAPVSRPNAGSVDSGSAMPLEAAPPGANGAVPASVVAAPPRPDGAPTPSAVGDPRVVPGNNPSPDRAAAGIVGVAAPADTAAAAAGNVAIAAGATALVDKAGTPAVAGAAHRPAAPLDGGAAAVAGAIVATGPAAAVAPIASAATATGVAARSGDGSLGEQVAHHLVGTLAAGRLDVVLRLHPPELGELNVRVQVDGHRVSAWFDSSVPAVQQALSQSIGQLQVGLAAAGYALNDAWIGGGAGSPRGRAAPLALRATRAAGGMLAPASAGGMPAAAGSGVSLYV